MPSAMLLSADEACDMVSFRDQQVDYVPASETWTNDEDFLPVSHILESSPSTLKYDFLFRLNK